MSRKLTILVAPMDAVGHFNASIGIAEQLRDRGHKVVFAIPDNWRNKLAPQGFIEEWLNPANGKEVNTDTVPKLDTWGEMVQNMAPLFVLSPEEKIEKVFLPMFTECLKQAKECDPRLREIVKEIKPDLILADQAIHQPAIMNAGIPWVLLVSANPVGVSSKNVPPSTSGYPTGEENRKDWEKYANTFYSVFKDLLVDLRQWVVENGGPAQLKLHIPYLLNYSPHANVYMYPKELDYTEFRPNPSNFHRFDAFVRNAAGTFEIPDTLKNKPGKLVYFSMGSIGCSELGLMRRLISILAKSPHRFIVSKGPLTDKIELAHNMWGAASVPQTKVIPLVDLVISHGGNNTVTETFYFGKRILVLPLFGDQPDNGQRIHQTGLGMQFHPYKVTEEELLAAIEKLLADEELAEKMSQISKRIQSSNSQSRVADLIENIAKNNKI